MLEDKMSDTTVSGLVTEIIYKNEENSYTVCALDTGDDEIVIVGTFPVLSVGEKVEFTGKWTFHPTHGPQFKADFYENTAPKSRTDIMRYLSSGVIKGVRAATAKKIVDTFGDGTLDILADNPERLSEIKGISREKALSIGESYAKQIGIRDVVMFLQKFSVSPSIAYTIYKKYGLHSVAVIKENPYILAEEIHGIGFKTADEIAHKMGYDRSSPFRLGAGILHIMYEAALNGHTYLPRKALLSLASDLLGVTTSVVDANVGSLILESRLITDICDNYEAIYLPMYFRAELGCARRLKELFESDFSSTADNPDKLIKRVEKEIGITLAAQQKAAIKAAITGGITIITGGPGTGKTTIINSIIKIMRSLGKDIFLAAPTGRAAKRMTEICREEAKTIHRLLEYSPSEDSNKQHFVRNEQNPLACDVLIVDEMSMVDTLLFYALLKAVKYGTRIILVGDADQLPSVGAGNVLHDIIASDSLPVVKLNTIFRQEDSSMIVVNAHKINNGEYPVIDNKSTDFFFIRRDAPESIAETVVSLCRKRLPDAYGYNPLTQIQILTPMRRSSVGVNIFNEKLQSILNPPSRSKPEFQIVHTVFRLNDKVMQTKNNYNLEWRTNPEGDVDGAGVFNGDIGYITSVDIRTREITVLFDDEKYVTYNEESSAELELAYAMTIHKSQGSEFDVVIIPAFPSAPMLQNRNLLYTAVTRAKKMVILVGQEYIIKRMVDNINENKRYSGLEYRLSSAQQINRYFT